jgi:WD40 repeat protein
MTQQNRDLLSVNDVMVGAVRIAVPPVRSLALHAVSGGRFLLAVGCDDGRVLLHLIAGGSAKEILSQMLHEGPVTSVVFAGSDRIVTGGRDRSVCVASFDHDADAPRFCDQAPDPHHPL